MDTTSGMFDTAMETDSDEDQNTTEDIVEVQNPPAATAVGLGSAPFQGECHIWISLSCGSLHGSIRPTYS